ncbi:hypothetical protein PSQ40_09730 [Curvibacter sp. HBC61]|uniref:Lipocalin-like domain-containing protein n=1 Tax=Curvibacter cyanobacteriorum TaxID=3026422 RepID=A0ABT5MYE8_9BURK|nr:hypothetical protein [Curvibacter sp. HBC61]MDD0838847.1 hypothetical protein [Curvibacter sp. HBC61]
MTALHTILPPPRPLPTAGAWGAGLLKLSLAGVLALGGSLPVQADAPPPPAAPSAPSRCPEASELQASDLYGLWRAEFSPGPAQPITLLLERHPELPDSVRGVLQRDGQRVWLSGDVDNGDFTLEESDNGRNISATWLGEVTDQRCGREIKGTWTSEKPPQTRQFVLRKLAE